MDFRNNKFSIDYKKQSGFKITENIMQEGVPFVKVSPKLIRNDDKSIDVTFLIEPSDKKYIDKIIISGNTRSLDKVIRRRLRIAEGDS